jgi:hypothetical protein
MSHCFRFNNGTSNEWKKPSHATMAKSSNRYYVLKDDKPNFSFGNEKDVNMSEIHEPVTPSPHLPMLISACPGI